MKESDNMSKREQEALNNKEYLNIVRYILESQEFNKRKEYKHHGDKSVYDHSIEVSYLAYKISKKLGLDYKDTAIGGLLHDFYYYDWHITPKEKNILKKHGFTHAKQALENTKKCFPQYLNFRTQDIILRHMFPLNIVPPKYLESWIVSISDKIVSVELIKNKDMLLCLGIKKRSKKDE